MSHYPRSVVFRVLGVVAGGAIWFGLIVLALANFDTPVGFPEEMKVVWPFLLVALALIVSTFFVRRRLGPGAGWGAFMMGVMAPFVGLVANANLGDGGWLWFWVPILVVVLLPWPKFRQRAPKPGN